MTDLPGGTGLIRYTNSEGSVVNFQYGPPFHITGREGFEAVENEIITDVQSDMDGEILLGTRAQKRDLLLEAVLIGETIEDRYNLRRELIKVLSPKLTGTLTYFVPNGKEYEIDVVPQSTTFTDFTMSDSTLNQYDQVSIRWVAADPYWRDISIYNSLISLSQVDNQFVFPLVIPSGGFVFASIRSGEIKTVENNGDVEVGGVFSLKVYTRCKNPRIFNILTGEYFGFIGEYEVGTIITVNSQRNQKKVTKTMDGISVNAMPERDPNSTFLLIRKGQNHFQIQCDEGVSGTIGTLEFKPLVIGV